MDEFEYFGCVCVFWVCVWLVDMFCELYYLIGCVVFIDYLWYWVCIMLDKLVIYFYGYDIMFVQFDDFFDCFVVLFV